MHYPTFPFFPTFFAPRRRQAGWCRLDPAEDRAAGRTFSFALVLAWLFPLAFQAQARAGELPFPGGGWVTFKSGTYTIEGETIRIQIEVAREKGFDGPVSVGCVVRETEGVCFVEEGKGEGTQQRLAWANTERGPRTVELRVSRSVFSRATEGIEVSLTKPTGAGLGRTTSLLAFAGDFQEMENGALAQAGRRIFLRVKESEFWSPPAEDGPERALAAADSRNSLPSSL